MIALQNVSKIYGETAAVHELNLTVEEGETLVLLGTSGCGKTTTLRMINRLVEPTSGTIRVNGVDVLQQQPEQLRRSIGYVLQHHGLFPHYTVAENIAIVPRLLGWQPAQIEARQHELMEKLQLPEGLARQYPRQLSGGQQQRVGLARALAAKPPVLLMDEPLGALDPVTRSGIRKEFKKLDELKNKTIILVTHDVQEAFELADRVCLMDKGRIVQLDRPAGLLFKPANDFIRSFLADQRLQLELESITLQELQQALPEATAATPAMLLDEGLSLWAAMEIIAADINHQFVTGAAQQQRRVTAAAIMEGFAALKTSRHE